MNKGSARIDMDKVREESRFDGKWVLTTHTDLSARNVLYRLDIFKYQNKLIQRGRSDVI